MPLIYVFFIVSGHLSRGQRACCCACVSHYNKNYDYTDALLPSALAVFFFFGLPDLAASSSRFSPSRNSSSSSTCLLSPAISASNAAF